MTRYLILVLLILLLLSCSKPTSNDNTPQSFSLTIKLLDTNNQPLDNYIVAVGPSIDTEEYHFRPTTYIPFTIAHTCHAKFEVQDYFGNHVKTLMDLDLHPGNHTAFWNSTDDSGNFVNRDGLYKFRLECFENNQSVFCDSTYGYQLVWLYGSRSPYSTNSHGECTITSKLPFPILYNEQIIPKTDEESNNLGDIDFSDQFRVIVCQADSTGEPLGEKRYQVFTIHDDLNTLTLNWDTLNILNNTAQTSKQIKKVLPIGNQMLSKDVPSSLYKLYPVYPNPYN